MDENRARELLAAERARVQESLEQIEAAATDEREAAIERGTDMSDPAAPLNEELTENAIADGLRQRLSQIERAEQRLAAGTYGRSVRSGQPIPDERLEADPAAELTFAEADHL